MKIEDIYNNLPLIETKRLKLRKLTLDDAEDMHLYGSNKEVTKHVFWDTHQSLSDTEAFIQYALDQYKNKQIAPWGIEHKQDKKLIGTIDFVRWLPEHRIAEIGYVIAPDYWGRGIATEAANAVIEFGFTKMNLIRIEAKCFKENIASARVMEKAGMTLEGIIQKGIFAKNKHWDLKLYSILRDEFFQIHN